jgi:catechol 2,3-dioxygenase-like lactoylglutathione lyase family enzyme
MPQIKQLGRVMVPVTDQDEAIAFYTNTLGFTLTADIPFGDGQRWVEVAPPGGGASIALVPPQGQYQPGRMTGIALDSSDPRADHSELQQKGVDVDAELMGGDGTVPLLFMFRDHDRNQLMVVQAQ